MKSCKHTSPIENSYLWRPPALISIASADAVVTACPFNACLSIWNLTSVLSCMFMCQMQVQKDRELTGTYTYRHMWLRAKTGGRHRHSTLARSLPARVRAHPNTLATTCSSFLATAKAIEASTKRAHGSQHEDTLRDRLIPTIITSSRSKNFKLRLFASKWAEARILRIQHAYGSSSPFSAQTQESGRGALSVYHCTRKWVCCDSMKSFCYLLHTRIRQAFINAWRVESMDNRIWGKIAEL